MALKAERALIQLYHPTPMRSGLWSLAHSFQITIYISLKTRKPKFSILVVAKEDTSWIYSDFLLINSASWSV